MNAIFTPLLFGVITIYALCRWLVWWQQERTYRTLTIFIVVLLLCLLYLSLALGFPLMIRDGIRVLLVLALVAVNFLEWRDLLAFLRQKEKAHGADAVKLRDIAEDADAPPLATSEAPPVEQK